VRVLDASIKENLWNIKEEPQAKLEHEKRLTRMLPIFCRIVCCEDVTLRQISAHIPPLLHTELSCQKKTQKKWIDRHYTGTW